MNQVLKSLLFLALIFCLAACGFMIHQRLTGNFHAVVEGVLYRSAQLSFQQFEDKIRAHGIKTVINLRGGDPTDNWYVEEIRATSNGMAKHVDFPMSAVREISDVELDRLITLLRESAQPILVHCEAGADRSGLVSAIFEILLAKQPAFAARDQLSLRYGHFPWLGNPTIAMDSSLERIIRQRMPSSAVDEQIVP